MDQAYLSLIQPANNTQAQKSFSKGSETNDSKFSDVFEKVVHEQSKEVTQKDRTANNKDEMNDVSVKGSETVQTTGEVKKTDKISNSNESTFDSKEAVSAKDFLEKLGLDEAEIKKLLQMNELSENATLLELLNAFNFEIDNPDHFLESSAIDFLARLGLDNEQINQLTIGQTENSNIEKAVDGNSKPVISVKNLFENIGLIHDKSFTPELDDIPANNFFQKLGLNEKETLNLVRDFNADNPLNDKSLFDAQETSAKDILKQMGLNSDEIAKVMRKNLENADDKSKVKNLILNKDFSGLKKLVSSEKFNIDLSGKSDFQGMFQVLNGKNTSDAFAARVPSEMVLPTNPALDSSNLSPLQTSGPMNGTNGITNLTKLSNEIPADSRPYDATPKAFFEKTVIDQFVSKVSFKVTGGQEEIKIHLDPPSLGSLQMKISVQGKTVNAAIMADSNITKEIIQSNLHQLKDSMADQGLKLDNISVLVGDGTSRDRDFDEFRMLFTKDQMNQDSEAEHESNSNLIEQNSRHLYRSGYEFSKSGVDLFI